MRPRPPNLTEKLAAALLEIQRLRGDPIDREHAKEMPAECIVSLFQCDHDPVRVETAQALGWSPMETNHPTNLDFKFIKAHRIKTAKKDAPEIAKGRKVIAAEEDFRRRMLAKDTGNVSRETLPTQPKSRWPKGQKMQSRGFQKGHRPMRRARP